MKTELVPQRDCPPLAVVVDSMAGGHLRLGYERLIDAIQRVEHEITVISRRPRPGPDRIEDGEAGDRHEPQHLVVRCAPDPGRRRTTGGYEAARRSGAQKSSTLSY